MRQTWRWFGPDDRVTVDDMMQAGVEGVVSALHHVPTGTVWTPEEIAKRQSEIAAMRDGTPSGLAWEVVESLPVSEGIKRQTGEWRAHLDAWKQSLRHLHAAGLRVICYNFMPVLDWTRTDLAHRLGNGATCMRFDLDVFAAFDIHILARDSAARDYPQDVVERAGRAFAGMTAAGRERLVRNVVFGLPGAAESFSLDDLRAQLAAYAQLDADGLRANLIDFLSEVTPLAEELGMRLCCHPDDPPFPLLGLPRVMSTEADYARIMEAVDLPANGITLCSGSLGVRGDNDLPGMMDRLGDRVHFLHLRNVKREGASVQRSFHEAAHLEGDTDMVALVAAALREEARREASGRSDISIPFRPDHGQDILDDLTRDAQPGYPAIGRLKGAGGVTRHRRGADAWRHRMSAPRLRRIADVTGSARLPGYDPEAHGVGIVHLGLGAFHRAHQAAITDSAMGRSGGDWRITAVSLRSRDLADALAPQNGLFTLIERGAEGGDGARRRLHRAGSSLLTRAPRSTRSAIRASAS